MVLDLDSKLEENREGPDCARPYLFDALDWISIQRNASTVRGCMGMTNAVASNE